MAAAVAAARDGAFAVFYRTAVDADPIQVSVREAAAVEFESAAPFRRLRSRYGQRNFVGAWWMSTTKRHVTCESWCERDHLIAFDFDFDFNFDFDFDFGASIVGIAAQPFAFEFITTNDSRQTHIPDYFLRTASGGAVVVDVKTFVGRFVKRVGESRPGQRSGRPSFLAGLGGVGGRCSRRWCQADMRGLGTA